MNEQQYYKPTLRPVRFSKPDRSEKIDKAKRISLSAHQVVIRCKIKLNIS